MFTYIRKNNTVMCQGIFMLHPWGSDTLVTVFPVQEGDKIDLAIKTEYTGSITFPDYSNYGSNHGITYLKVERQFKKPLVNFVQSIKDFPKYKYFSCGKCRTKVRIPRKKGNVMITCPKCKNRFAGRS